MRYPEWWQDVAEVRKYTMDMPMLEKMAEVVWRDALQVDSVSRYGVESAGVASSGSQNTIYVVMGIR